MQPTRTTGGAGPNTTPPALGSPRSDPTPRNPRGCSHLSGRSAAAPSLPSALGGSGHLPHPVGPRGARTQLGCHPTRLSHEHGGHASPCHTYRRPLAPPCPYVPVTRQLVYTPHVYLHKCERQRRALPCGGTAETWCVTTNLNTACSGVVQAPNARNSN